MPRLLVRAAHLLALSLLACSTAFAHAVREPLEAAPVAPAAGAPVESLSGQIHRVTIDDRVVGVQVDLVSLELPDGTAVALKGAATAAFQTGDRVSASGARNGKSFFVTAAQRTGGPAVVPKSRVESRTGRLALLHIDRFDEAKSGFVFELQESAAQSTQLRFPVLPEALQAGMQVVVSGPAAQDGSGIVPETVTIVSMPPAPTVKAVTTKAAVTNNTLVILMTFTDSPATPFTQTQVQNVFAGGPGSGSVTEFFKEVSYGQQLLNATVTDWLPTGVATPAGCNYTQIGVEGRNAATTAGFDLSAYKNVVYVFPQIAACGWIGLAYVGASGAWINGRNVNQVYAHELGHNFGLLHAGSLRCNAGAIGGSCTVAEYGDPFGAMGNINAMHYNALQKLDLGWISAGSVTTQSVAGTSTYQLSPLELGGGTTYAVKVPAATNRTYWLEYRQPIGFDAALASVPNNGVLVRVASPFETLCGGCDVYSNDTQLLDMTPWTSTFSDAALVVGNSFTDPTFGITFNVLSANSTALTLQVTTGGPITPFTTTTTLASSTNPALAGVNVTFTATVAGTSPTGTVSFADGGSPVAGCGSVALAGSGNSRTATCTTNSLAAGAHGITASYSGDASNARSTSAQLAQTINAADPNNVALAVNGGSASASSTYGAAYPVAGIINGDRAGRGWGSGNGGWADATSGTYPDWVQVNFNGTKTIDRVIVYTVQDNYSNPVEPTDTTTFSLYGIRDFTVQGWDGASWVTLGTVIGNNLVKRTVTFGAFSTDRIRVNITSALASYSRITEVEAIVSSGGPTTTPTTTALTSSVNPSSFGASVSFTATVSGAAATAPTGSVTFTDNGTSIAGCVSLPVSASGNSAAAACTTTALAVGTHTIAASYGGDILNAPSTSAAVTQTVNDPSGPSVNVALAANGGVASASSLYSANYAVSGVNNGDRAGRGWGAGTGGWADGTANAYPDWVQITFNGSKTIDHVTVYTIQDKYSTPVEPTDTMTFTLYGIRDFTVQGWDANTASWVTLGTVTGNNLVKRNVAFAGFTTDRIRVNVTGALNSYSRIAEIEAWTAPSGGISAVNVAVPAAGVPSCRGACRQQALH